MNKPVTLKITFLLFFVIICQFTLRAQDTAKKIIVVVRPGQNTSTPANTTTPANSTTKPANNTPASATNRPANTSTNPNATTAPVKTPASTYIAPTTAERTGTPDYINHIQTKKPVVTPPAAVPAITTGGANVPVTGSTVTPARSGALTPPPAIVKPVKKDTVFITKIKTDTVIIKPPKHKGNKILFAEVGGPGLAISLNYDTRFSGEKSGLGFRIGAGYYGDGGNTVFTVPFQVNYLLGSNGKFLELGGGTTFLNSTGDNHSSSTFIFDRVTGFIGTATIGFRYEPDKSLNFRLGYVPILYDEGIINAGGFSIGYTF
jgi:hypothetical protein